MTVANGNLEARVWCRNEAKAAEKGLKAWQSVSECHKEVLRWHSGMTVAMAFGLARLVFASPSSQRAWRDAIRQFRTARKRCRGKHGMQFRMALADGHAMGQPTCSIGNANFPRKRREKQRFHTCGGPGRRPAVASARQGRRI